MATVEKTESGVKGTASRSEVYGTGKKLEDIRLTPAANGGFSAAVSYKRTEKKAKGGMSPFSDSYMPPETHVYGTFDDLVKGLRQCFGVKASKQEHAEGE